MKTINGIIKYITTSALCAMLVGLDISPALAEQMEQSDVNALFQSIETDYKNLPTMDLKENHIHNEDLYKFERKKDNDYSANYFRVSL